MAKLTDAQIGTLTRGAQHTGGFISPAPKTPAPMALQAAKKLEALGLVQSQPCFHDEPWYERHDESGEYFGYRLTAEGFEALGIDESEWPAYCQRDPEAPVDPQDEGEAAVHSSTGTAQVIETPTTAAEALDSLFGPTDEDGTADQPLVTAAELATSMKLAEANAACDAFLARSAASPLRGNTLQRMVQATDAFLATWDAEVAAGKGFSPALAEAVAQLRLAPHRVASAPKAAGEPGTPKPGSKLALVIELLSRKGGALAAEVEAATGWNNTSTRGFISSLKIKRGLAVATRKEAGTTRYWIGDDNAPEALPAAEKPAKAAKAEGEPAF